MTATAPATATATAPRAKLLIAEDEPLLAALLARALAAAWPASQWVGTVGDGLAAVRMALSERPDVCFLDIRMPGQSGLDAARDIAERWPLDAGPPPLFVFVTAFDQHALDAFDAAASDYLLKPIDDQRLMQTVRRLQERLAERRGLQRPDAAASHGRRTGASQADPRATVRPAPLRLIPAGLGTSVHFIPVEEVLMLEAADKYVRLVTAAGEHLVRTPLKELLAQLDPQEFWQVHRGTVVQARCIERAVREESGRMHLMLRGSSERPVVSRLYADRFRPL